MVLRARDVMTTRVVSVRPETSIDRARYLLGENRFSALPVVDDRQRLIGILTTFDLLRADQEPGSRPAATVGEIMTRNPMYLAPDATVPVIAHRLRQYGELRAMPIVDGGRLTGIVTRADLLTPEPSGGAVGRFLRRTRRREPRPPAPWGDDAFRTGPTVADVMTPLDVIYDATESTSVADAAAILRAHRFTALPVVDEASRVIGIVSEADLIPDRLSGRRTPPPRTVGQAMTPDPVCVPDDTPVAKAARTMVAHGLRLLPVIGADDRLVGVVSRGDVLRATAPPPAE
jgi:CBS domain-containing protein